ncbi:MAG: DUF2336 domain-containing protein [Pseudomonadota bacterium]
MTDPQSTQPELASSRARTALLRRLIDYIAMPASRVAPQDRSMGGDILLDMLFHASEEDRALCATRLKDTREAPRRVLRYLAQCSFAVAQPLLENNESFDASDLTQIVEQVTPEHRLAIAGRKRVPSAVCDRMVAIGENHVLRVLIANKGAEFSETAMDRLVDLSREDLNFCKMIITREELRPAQAMAMFWWSDAVTRRSILQRFAANRIEMIEMCSDVFAMAAEEGWSDSVARKALQLIERRQRNRAAIDKSPYDSLEDAVDSAELQGVTPELGHEIGYLSGVKPITVEKILNDPGGEGVAVLCKATGLKRDYLKKLWVASGRELTKPDGSIAPQFDYVQETFDLLTVAKAQTTLRYWNWSLSSTYSPGQTNSGIDEREANDEQTYSTSRRTAQLVFGN